MNMLSSKLGCTPTLRNDHSLRQFFMLKNLRPTISVNLGTSLTKLLVAKATDILRKKGFCVGFGCHGNQTEYVNVDYSTDKI